MQTLLMKFCQGPATVRTQVFLSFSFHKVGIFSVEFLVSSMYYIVHQAMVCYPSALDLPEFGSLDHLLKLLLYFIMALIISA
jgi:hypothetical protein